MTYAARITALAATLPQIAGELPYRVRVNSPSDVRLMREQAAAIAAEADTELSALRARVAELERDAARYRRLREIAVHGPFWRHNYEYAWFDVWAQHEPGFDSAIDTAISKSTGDAA